MKKGLGKGLGALIEESDNSLEGGVIEIKINDIETNQNQPRKNFDEDKMLKLAESIKQHGIIQPIIVKKEDKIYRIIAGERRWRAARMAGKSTIPVIIKELSTCEEMEIALIENIQREDLNPIEEAEAYERLIKEYNMTHEELSIKIGKSRPAITNTIRLLGLSDAVKYYVITGELSNGNARALLSIEDKEIQNKFAEEIIKEQLNVRETENMVRNYVNNKGQRNKNRKLPNVEFNNIEDNLQTIFGTKVRILSNKNKKGKIMIEYYSHEELDRILDLVKVIPESFNGGV